MTDFAVVNNKIQNIEKEISGLNHCVEELHELKVWAKAKDATCVAGCPVSQGIVKQLRELENWKNTLVGKFAGIIALTGFIVTILGMVIGQYIIHALKIG